MPRTLRIAATICALAVALSVAGCNTMGSLRHASTVRTNDVSYQTGQDLPPDIKQILMAGGLDADNPSAPTRAPIALASVDLDTMPAEAVVQVAAGPPSRQVLMAARGIAPGHSVPSLAVGTRPVAPRLHEILLANASKGSRTRPSVVAAAKPLAKVSAGLRLAAVKVPVPPASPVGRKPVPETQGSPVRFASIGEGDVRAGQRGGKAEAPPKKVVRRF